MCGAGKWSDTSGASGPETCENCPEGTYSSATGVVEASDCNYCPPGRANANVGGDSRGNCTLCPVGQYQNEPGKATCKAVDPGFERSGETTQIACPRGQFGQNATSGCSDCPQDSFSNTTNQTSCYACPVGKSTESTGSAKCTPCGAGRYGIGCKKCAAGQFRAGDDEDASKCKVCTPGFSQDKPAQASCLPCVPGKYQSHANRSECDECGVDTFSNTTELTDCFAFAALACSQHHCVRGWLLEVDVGEA